MAKRYAMLTASVWIGCRANRMTVSLVAGDTLLCCRCCCWLLNWKMCFSQMQWSRTVAQQWSDRLTQWNQNVVEHPSLFHLLPLLCAWGNAKKTKSCTFNECVWANWNFVGIFQLFKGKDINGGNAYHNRGRGVQVVKWILVVVLVRKDVVLPGIPATTDKV